MGRGAICKIFIKLKELLKFLKNLKQAPLQTLRSAPGQTKPIYRDYILYQIPTLSDLWSIALNSTHGGWCAMHVIVLVNIFLSFPREKGRVEVFELVTWKVVKGPNNQVRPNSVLNMDQRCPPQKTRYQTRVLIRADCGGFRLNPTHWFA